MLGIRKNEKPSCNKVSGNKMEEEDKLKYLVLMLSTYRATGEEVAHMLQVLWTVRKSWKESVTSRE